MRVTHQPSPWIADYGNFLIKASIPGLYHAKSKNFYGGYSPKKSIFTPYLFNTTFLSYGTGLCSSNSKFKVN